MEPPLCLCIHYTGDGIIFLEIYKVKLVLSHYNGLGDNHGHVFGS